MNSLSVTCTYCKDHLLAGPHHQLMSCESSCTDTVELMNFRLDVIPPSGTLQVNCQPFVSLCHLLTSIVPLVRCPRMQHHNHLKYSPYVWTLLQTGAERWGLIQIGSTHGKDWLNVITPGVDLILWALVLLSHWFVRSSHLSVKSVQSFPSCVAKMRSLHLMNLFMEGKTWPVHQTWTGQVRFLAALPFLVLSYHMYPIF